MAKRLKARRSRNAALGVLFYNIRYGIRTVRPLCPLWFIAIVLFRAGRVPLYQIACEAERFPPRYGGRSDYWWNRHLEADRLQDLFPGMFGSYKVDELEDGPRDFSVVCFHGGPKQTALMDTWVGEAWSCGIAP